MKRVMKIDVIIDLRGIDYVYGNSLTVALKDILLSKEEQYLLNVYFSNKCRYKKRIGHFCHRLLNKKEKYRELVINHMNHYFITKDLILIENPFVKYRTVHISFPFLM
jgi:hypothetical protein